jgi:hypothetical protein
MTEPKDIKFQKPKLVYDKLFGINTKKIEDVTTTWESQEKYPRFMADINGDGRADIIGFGHDSISVSIATWDGRYENTFSLGNSFTYSGDGWKIQNTYPIVMGDINGDGKADIVGFGKEGVYAMISYGDHFAPKYKLIDNYSLDHTWSSQNQVPRMIADVNGDGWADIIGFGAHHVHVSFAIPTTRGATQVKFTQPQLVLESFCIHQGWESQEKFPRFMADINGDGKADIVGFGSGKVFVAFSTGTGFEQPQAFPEFFTSNVGYSWNDLDQNGKSLYGRSIADINGDGKADIVGFYYWGTIVMTSNGREFNPPYIAHYEFSYDKWGMPNTYPRMLADVNGDGKADIVGFKADGVYVSLIQSVSPLALDLEACERFSPSIEVKCMEKIYNKAMRQLDKLGLNAQALQDAKKDLTQSYNDYAASTVPLQNSNRHFSDDTIRAREAQFAKTMETADLAVAESSKLEALSGITKNLETLRDSKVKISADDYSKLFSGLSGAQKLLNAATSSKEIEGALSSTSSITGNFADLLGKATNVQTAKLSAIANSLLEEAPEDNESQGDPFAGMQTAGSGDHGAGQIKFTGDHLFEL